MRPRLFFLLLLILSYASCYPPPTSERVYQGDRGYLVIYLQPMPQEAEKLRFTLDSISLLHSDGSSIPLPLLLDELSGVDRIHRQTRLAEGYLPEDSYAGVTIETNKAFLKGQEGESALLVNDPLTRLEYAFRLKQQASSVLFLSFRPSGAKTGGLSFTPVFALSEPTRVLTSFTGYVSNSETNTLTVFNKRTMLVENIISTGRSPFGLAIDRRRARAYVAVLDDNAVQEIDVIEGTILGKAVLSLGDDPIDVAVTPDGRHLISVNRGSNTISIIDAVSLIELERIRVGDKPCSVEISPTGLLAFVLNSYSNTLSCIDLSQNIFAGTLAVQGSPRRGAFSRNGRRFYVITSDSPTMTVIDVSSLTSVGSIHIGPGASSIKVDTRTDLVYVGKSFGAEISIVSPRSSLPIDSIFLRGSAEHMTIDDEENSLFVVLPEKRLLQKMNLTSKRVTAELDVGIGAYEVALMGER